MTTIKKRFIVAAIITCVISVVIYILWKSNSTSRYTVNCDYLTNKEIALLQDGDIIIRKGFGFVSNKIADILDEPYNVSHCGIIYRPDSSALPIVIHSVSSTLSDIDGVQECDIEKFARESEAYSIIVVRYNDSTKHSPKIIATEAQRMLLANIPFDNSFDISDSSKIYCSELIWKILNDKFGHDIYPSKSSLRNMGFAPLIDSTHFRIIINHNKSIR